jgi:hypothetical protein
MAVCITPFAVTGCALKIRLERLARLRLRPTRHDPDIRKTPLKLDPFVKPSGKSTDYPGL